MAANKRFPAAACALVLVTLVSFQYSAHADILHDIDKLPFTLEGNYSMAGVVNAWKGDDKETSKKIINHLKALVEKPEDADSSKTSVLDMPSADPDIPITILTGMCSFERIPDNKFVFIASCDTTVAGMAQTSTIPEEGSGDVVAMSDDSTTSMENSTDDGDDVDDEKDGDDGDEVDDGTAAIESAPNTFQMALVYVTQDPEKNYILNAAWNPKTADGDLMGGIGAYNVILDGDDKKAPKELKGGYYAPGLPPSLELLVPVAA